MKRVHIVGVCGTLMGAFAALLKRKGIDVSGSDENVYPPMSDVLREAGVRLMEGYRAENLDDGGRPDMVVIGNVIRRDNPEARHAIDGGYPYGSLPEFMEHLLLVDTRNLVVSGTHGKTTTSTLLTHVLKSCGADPSWFIGGVSHDLPHSFNVSDSGKYFVLEGDEYDTAFWDKVPKFNHYRPDDVILTSVEYDHADIYPDMESIMRAFNGLMERIRPGGRLIACTDYAAVRELAARAKVPVITYGRDAKYARYRPAGIRPEDGGIAFDILDGERVVARLKLSLTGNHNVLNALSVWIEATQLGFESDRIAEALAAFRGVRRRQEVRGEVSGVTVIDDFAHHPTAVRETLIGLRQKYPDRRLIAVFEPRSATSRRKVFQNEYPAAFGGADATFIARPYDQTRIPEEDRFSSERMVEDLAAQGRYALIFDEVDQGVSEVARYAKPGDVVAVLSNGGFGGFIPKLLDRLR